MERCERTETTRGTSWRARFSFVDERGKRRWRRVAGKTKEECRKKLAAGKQAPRRTASKESLAVFLARWLAYRRPMWRGSTYASHAMMIRVYLAPAFGDMPLAKLSADDIAAAESEWLAAGKSPATVRMAHATLRTALNQAVSWKLVPRNESSLVKPPREAGDPMRALSATETARVLAAADKTPLAAFWHVAAACGLRRGEAMGLQWRDIDFERATLSIQRQVTRHGDVWVVSEPKTKKSRRLIVLPEPVVAALRKHRARQNAARLKAGDLWQDGDWVFADALGRRVTIGAITYAHQQ
ncbi:MAG TPA: tyrosine-type recombinase/integrase, partial [Thermomicrobiales bacterium]|nr:tyrosine-type recombinase/integrase [Thermomicrobiales bacterium]